MGTTMHYVSRKSPTLACVVGYFSERGVPCGAPVIPGTSFCEHHTRESEAFQRVFWREYFQRRGTLPVNRSALPGVLR